jgi:hypothetical protein
MPKISGNGDVAGDLILPRKLRLKDFNGLLAIDTLRLKIGLAFFWSDECTVERGIGVRREWTFTRPKDQPKLSQVQGLPQRGK